MKEHIMGHFASHAEINDHAERLIGAGVSRLDAYGLALREAANDAHRKDLISDINSDYQSEIGIDKFTRTRLSRHGKPAGENNSDNNRNRQMLAQASMDSLGDNLFNAIGKFFTGFSLSELSGNAENCKKAATDIINSNIDKITAEVPEMKDPAVKEQAADNLGQVMMVQAFVIQTAIPLENLSENDVSCSAEQAFANDQSCVNTDATVTDIQNTSGVKMTESSAGTDIELDKDFYYKTEALLGMSLIAINEPKPKPTEELVGPMYRPSLENGPL